MKLMVIVNLQAFKLLLVSYILQHSRELPRIPSNLIRMEFEHLRRHHHHPIHSDQVLIVDADDKKSNSSSSSPSRGKYQSFHLVDKRLPRSDDSTEKKLRWLRSQIIGADAEFDTPFGRRLLTYADHTASGRCIHFVEKYIQKNLLPVYGNTHTTDSHVGYQTTRMAHEASNYVKECLGGGEDDALMFCGSGSTAAIKRLQEVMGITVPSILRERVLRCLTDEERWVVFIGPYEHHSNILSWRQSLAEVVEVGMDSRGFIDMEELRGKLSLYNGQNRPILGSFSACSNVTGICTDTRSIARLVHQFGGFVCFDFAASGPYVKIDMRSGAFDGYDAIFLSTHKFVGGPSSPGILLMSRSLYRLGSSPPSTCGGGTVDFVNGYSANDTLYIENISEREDAGTPPIIQKIRAALAFWIKEYIGYKAIEKQEQSYVERARERLLSNNLICVLGSTTAKRQAVFSFLVYSTTSSSSSMDRIDIWSETGYTRSKPLHGPFVAKLLNDLFGIQARGGCACAGPYGHILLGVDESHSRRFRSAIQKGYAGIKPGWTRVSFPYYMREEEVEYILAAIDFISIYGQRFLPWYHFNWKTGAWTFKKNQGRDNIIKASNLEINAVADEDTVGTYTNYLETAQRIANNLPRFPPQRKVPEDIDLDLVPFRV